MLDLTALQQLKQLKTSIRQEARRYEGIVVGSRANYGFVRTTKGRQYFLPPNQMQRTFPGDRIDFTVKTDDQGRDFAEVEKLLSSEFKVFCGKCVQHRNAWFVVADVPQLQRKIFLPPKTRKGIAPGDWLKCQLSRHPINDGKAQARVKQRIGDESSVDFPSHYATVNFQIPRHCKIVLDAQDLLQRALQQPRVDHTAYPLVSIDAAHTLDIDDALYAKATAAGWQLVIAIADPSSVISADSATDREARFRASTTYLPHFKAPMLPEELSEDLFSLKANETRPAIVCTLQIAQDGEVLDTQFDIATVRSRAQLSYAKLNEHLTAASPVLGLAAELEQSLAALEQVTTQLQRRRYHQPLGRQKVEFNQELDDRGRIERFEAIRKGPAERLVEQCMIAVNSAVGERLAAANVGIFATHKGFRTERLADIQALLDEVGIDARARELNEPVAFHRTMAQLRERPDGEQLLDVLSRFLQRSALSATPAPHVGLGVTSYATFTSPLRRYTDLHNHQQLRALLLQDDASTPSDPQTIEALEDQLSRVRAASQWAQRWLQADFATRQRNALKQRALVGKIAQVNHLGLTVRLENTGIEGLIEKRTLPEGMKLDSKRLEYRGSQGKLALGDTLTVSLAGIKRDQREILLTWLPPTDAHPTTAVEPAEAETAANRDSTHNGAEPAPDKPSPAPNT